MVLQCLVKPGTALVMEYSHVTHESLKPFIHPDSKILILGSLPSIATRKANFYYAHKTNRFYKILAGVFGEEEPISTEERKVFLKKHKIALYDSIYECDIRASSDSSIRNVISTKDEIGKIKKEHDIRAVFTTGKASHDVYRKYIGDDDIPLPSPSAANAACSLDKLIGSYKIILSFL